MRLFQIFQDIEEEDAFVVRTEKTREWESRHSTNEIALILLSPQDNLSFKAILATIPPGSYEKIIQLRQGEVFISVRKGQLGISLPNKKNLLLNQGDTAHLTSLKSTVLRNLNREISVQILIIASVTTQHLDKHDNPLTYSKPVSYTHLRAHET